MRSLLVPYTSELGVGTSTNEMVGGGEILIFQIFAHILWLPFIVV